MQTYGFSFKIKRLIFNKYACCLLNIVYLLIDIR